MIRKIIMAGVLTLALVPALASAQTSAGNGIGPRVGFSLDPDQILFGGQLTFSGIAPSLSFDPSLDIGLGDDLTTLALNLDLHYHFRTSTTWHPYAGGGATLNYVNYDDDRYDDESDTEAGGSLIIGAVAPTRGGNRFFTELKFGLGDSADFKAMVGWNFKM